MHNTILVESVMVFIFSFYVIVGCYGDYKRGAYSKGAMSVIWIVFTPIMLYEIVKFWWVYTTFSGS